MRVRGGVLGACGVGGPGTLTLNKRKSTWRRAEPSDAQKRYGYNLRIAGVTKDEDGTFTSALSKGELSEAIDAVNAARRIDPIVAMVVARQRASE